MKCGRERSDKHGRSEEAEIGREFAAHTVSDQYAVGVCLVYGDEIQHGEAVLGML